MYDCYKIVYFKNYRRNDKVMSASVYCRVNCYDVSEMFLKEEPVMWDKCTLFVYRNFLN